MNQRMYVNLGKYWELITQFKKRRQGMSTYINKNRRVRCNSHVILTVTSTDDKM